MDATNKALSAWEGRGGKRPFFIGIGGGSASGKSTLAKAMAERLAPLEVEVINSDRFFKKPEDMPQYFSGINQDYRPAYNEPDSLKQEEMFAHCREIASGDVVILEGILVLWFEQLRALMDLKVYIEADADERIVRRIRRDMKSIDAYDRITDYYLESVRWQHAEYNAPTKAHADLVIPGGMRETAEREAVVERVCAAMAAYPALNAR